MEGGTVGEKLPRILPKLATSTSLLGSFTCRKFTTWGWRLYFPSEGRRAEDFFAQKIRRLRLGLNPWNSSSSEAWNLVVDLCFWYSLCPVPMVSDHCLRAYYSQFIYLFFWTSSLHLLCGLPLFLTFSIVAVAFCFGICWFCFHSTWPYHLRGILENLHYLSLVTCSLSPYLFLLSSVLLLSEVCIFFLQSPVQIFYAIITWCIMKFMDTPIFLAVFSVVYLKLLSSLMYCLHYMLWVQ